MSQKWDRSNPIDYTPVINTILYNHNIIIDDILENRTPKCFPVKASQIEKMDDDPAIIRNPKRLVSKIAPNLPVKRHNAKNPFYRDVEYNEAVCDAIMHYYANSNHSIQYILDNYININIDVYNNNVSNKEKNSIIAYQVEDFYHWISKDESGVIKAKMQKCRADRARYLFDSGFSSVLDNMEQKLEQRDPETGKIVYSKARAYSAVATSRLRIEAMRWQIEKGNPREFGSRVDVNHNIQVNPRELREQAWEQRQKIDAKYTVHNQERQENIKRLNEGDGES